MCRLYVGKLTKTCWLKTGTFRTLCNVLQYVAMEGGKIDGNRKERRGESRVRYCGVGWGHGPDQKNTFELAQKQLKILITKENLLF